jgi:hypothetical protein
MLILLVSVIGFALSLFQQTKTVIYSLLFDQEEALQIKNQEYTEISTTRCRAEITIAMHNNLSLEMASLTPASARSIQGGRRNG